MVALLAGTDSIRDVIAFPKTSSGVDLLVGSPSEIEDRILEEYHLAFTLSNYRKSGNIPS